MKRILIFNCTSGRSGPTLLSKINGKVAAQARKYDPSSYFERVIFCTNVTYADGHFKGGELECTRMLRVYLTKHSRFDDKSNI